MADRNRHRRWYRWAACAGMPAELFFPDDDPGLGRVMEAAKHVCGRCPVRWACLADALACETPGERHGVVGGLSADEREQYTRGVCDSEARSAELGEVA